MSSGARREGIRDEATSLSKPQLVEARGVAVEMHTITILSIRKLARAGGLHTHVVVQVTLSEPCLKVIR